MAEFEDSLGRTWNLRLNVALNTAIRGRLGLDFLTNLEAAGESLAKIEANKQLLFDTVWLIVEPHARSIGVSIESFGESMGGETLGGALMALREAAVNFLEPREREVAKATLTLLAGLRTELLASVTSNPTAGV